MALYDGDFQEIEVDVTTMSLPDPTTVNGRTHEITNTSTGTLVVSSVGATPFSEGGVNVVTISIARGNSKQVQSDGVRWVVKTKSGSLAFFAATGTTDGAGNVTFNLTPAGFTSPPVVTLAFQGAASANPVDFRIVTLTAVSLTVNCRVATGIFIGLLGLTLLGASTPLSGATIHAMCTPAGSNPIT